MNSGRLTKIFVCLSMLTALGMDECSNPFGATLSIPSVCYNDENILFNIPTWVPEGFYGEVPVQRIRDYSEKIPAVDGLGATYTLVLHSITLIAVSGLDDWNFLDQLVVTVQPTDTTLGWAPIEILNFMNEENPVPSTELQARGGTGVNAYEYLIQGPVHVTLLVMGRVPPSRSFRINARLCFSMTADRRL